LVEFATVTK